MPLPAQNTNQIADELLVRLAHKTPLTEFERAKYVRHARAQNELDRTHAILSLVYTLSNERDKAIENALCALECMSQEATLALALLALHLNGAHEEVLSFRAQQRELLVHPGFGVGFAVSLHNLPILEELFALREACIRHGECGQAEGMVNMSELFLSKAIPAKRDFGIGPEVIDRITTMAAVVADEFTGVVMRAPDFEVSPLGESFDLIYRVQLNEEFESDLFDLNLSLADKIIESDLDSLPVVARFMRAPSDADNMAKQLVVIARQGN
ncbi:hypothetical protein ACPV5U_08750 [Vibrio mediterranei]